MLQVRFTRGGWERGSGRRAPCWVRGSISQKCKARSRWVRLSLESKADIEKLQKLTASEHLSLDDNADRSPQ